MHILALSWSKDKGPIAVILQQPMNAAEILDDDDDDDELVIERVRAIDHLISQNKEIIFTDSQHKLSSRRCPCAAKGA